MIVFAIFISLFSSLCFAEEPSLKELVKQFDRELDHSIRSETKWSLEDSPAYQKLRIHHERFHTARGEISNIAPGKGRSGQISGSEFPANTWAITYDDGPHETNTPRILSVLASFQIPATFFWVAENILRYPHLVPIVENAGHSPQNHSFTHRSLPKLGPKGLNYEVTEANKVMKAHYAADPRFYRLPFGAGSGNTKVRKKVAAEGLVSVVWNVDSLDWADPDPTSVAARIYKEMMKVGRGIVLMHDIQGHTAEASQILFTNLQGQPYRYMTVAAIVDEINAANLASLNSHK